MPGSLNRLILPAPAKLNLMLHITGRRPDGYHELQTVFQFIAYCDELEFSLREDDQILRVCDRDFIPAEEDIIIRAANTLRAYHQHLDATGLPGVDIRLHKIIPMGAGLGGGSSDAATTLLALNTLWQLNYDIEILADIGLELGADVPVFVQGFAAFGEGVGEKLTPVTLPSSWYLVVVPPTHVSTGKVFSHPDLTRDCSAIKICDLLQTEWRNVCTEVVAKEYPAVFQAIEILGNYAKAQMSGTGASVFARFDSRAEAEQILQQLENCPETDGWQCFVAQGLNRSPVHEKLGLTKSF